MLSRRLFFVLIVHSILYSSVKAFYDFPLFNSFFQENNNEESKQFNFESESQIQEGQKVEKSFLHPKFEKYKEQKTEKINLESEPKQLIGQEPETFHIGMNQRGQKIEEINFGSKESPPKRQEPEVFNFASEKEHPKGQVIEEINFGSKQSHPEELKREYHFGEKPKDHKSQIFEDPSFEAPGNPKKQEVLGFLKENFLDGERNRVDFLRPQIKGCLEKPETPANSFLRNNSDGRIEVFCQSGYSFSDGAKTIEFKCDGNKWVSSAEVIPECSPTCEPPCQNNGTCVATNQCHCFKNFEGAQCQFRHKPCSIQPPVPTNSHVNCNSSVCEVKCFDTYTFPDGTSTTLLVCHQGQWDLIRTDWNSLPQCKPSCRPPCINGGNCLDFNKCQCPRQYVGPQCQYELAACDARKLNFNGYYTCKGENDKVSCNLNCPEGYETEIPLAKEYVCYYSVGKFSPQPVPKCLYDTNMEVVQSASSSHTVNGGYDNFEISQIPYHSPSASEAECLSWNKFHYKNFDGKIFSFDGNCSYILAEDVVGNTFRIVTENSRCESCSRSLKIFYEDQEYKLQHNNGSPKLTVNDEEIPIPNQFSEFLVEKIDDRISVSMQAIDVTLNWNDKDYISVVISENLWNKTGGLCGKFNKNPSDDFLMPDGSTAWNLEIFIQSWVHDFYKCDYPANAKNYSMDDTAVDYCHKIFTNIHFENCFDAGAVRDFEKACIWDLNRCGKSCACETASVFVKNCKNHLLNEGIPDLTHSWRRISDCPLDCPHGKIYSYCGPLSQKTCGSFGMDESLGKYLECVEGCFCPEDLFQFNDTCVEKEYCPCKWRNKYYSRGERIMKDCNTCTCQNGSWECTTLKCFARCSIVGNSHYHTFDGKRYDFEGQCTYYLLKSDKYEIESESTLCDGDFTNEIFHSHSLRHSSCAKLITIRHKTDEIKLKKNKEVLVNGIEALSLPIEVKGISVRLSSYYIIVKLPDNIEIWWDGNTNVYIDLPGNYTQPTGGLCGTFNNDQKDDFITPEGDTEQTAVFFAEKWKKEEICTEIIDMHKSHPWNSNADDKEVAEKHCQKLKTNIFKDCHTYVDVEPYYRNCLYDVSSCQKELKNCFCPVFSAYATECARHFMQLSWRNEMRECGLHCPEGQIYQSCGDSCSRSCRDISILKGNCEKKCAEGCNCPDGFVLNSHEQCVPISDCPCFYQNVNYKPNHELIMESDNGLQFCTCQNALWSCRPATKTEIARDYENSDLKCNESLHEEYTTCQPAEPKTCKNMHEESKYSTRICFPGCVCQKGFVWDSIRKLCVNASECPCHHGGRSYADGEKIQQDCNSCTCENGLWSCTKRECPSICSTWGDSHFKTFDGKIYDFQGSCEFILASGMISEYKSFFISLQIVPCGATGISCPKSVTLKVGSPKKEEKVIFRKSSQSLIPRGLERILIREVGLFIFAEVFDLGIAVQWDRGARVYVKADSRWKNRVKGLCGNFNNNELDDFKTPSSGETDEIFPVIFADSWRLHTYCPESSPISDTCARRPHRKAWAVQKCSVLNSEIFEPCHLEISPQPFFERCIVDTCGCDEGGDCECLCTAIAAYAEECTLKGVPIKWRTQNLCPLQCEDNSVYNPCISKCPPKSCDNQFQFSALLQTCSEESCVEGCDKSHCPPGQVLADSSSNTCIPAASCKTICLTINNVTYLEGDLIDSDDCHSCYCSHHLQVCVGEPCHEATSTSFPPTPTSVCPEGQIMDDCIVRCDHICHYLMRTPYMKLQCSKGQECINGCRAIGLECSSEMFLRDEHTCVHKKNCPCSSLSGLLLKPGDVVQESECEKCQCINNEYECINTCPQTFTTQASFNYTMKQYTSLPEWDFSQEGNVTIKIFTTIAPSVLCPNKLYESLIDKFTRFSASSYLDESSSPAFGYLSSKGIWIAGADNTDQYLQVDLGKVEPIYAVNVAGSPENFVSGYHLLYSLNGDKFLNVINQDGKKEIFGGPFDGHLSVKQVLSKPIEARYIRFRPVLWHGKISMKVDVLGCESSAVHTTSHPVTTIPSICNKPIGIGQKYFPKLQITVTSSKPKHGIDFIGFGNEKGWRPLTNSKNEFVQLDFGENGNFTGITTKGVSQDNEISSLMEESWIERYKVEYSHDGLTWNPILDEFGNEMIFMGNTDGDSEKKNFFNRPIHAKSLKILPVKWHKNIALRLDVIGCYEPPRFELEVPPVTVPTANCNVCPGALINKDSCKCEGQEWWNGENCVNHSECPCFKGLIGYPVGTIFMTDKCEECVCRLHGIPHCTPKQCEDCPRGLQKFLTPLCGCTCKPCEESTRLCPTSNICIDESVWCNGIEDCPDDELNCTTFTEIVTPPNTPCITSCSPGYEVIYRNNILGPNEAENEQYMHSLKSVKTYRKSKKTRKVQKFTECPPYDCMPVKEVTPTECPLPDCPLDYLVVYETSEGLEKSCPTYSCEPVPPLYANCTVSSKNVKTFDGTEYKYEICDHILVTHDSGLWNVTMLKNCTFTLPCSTVLLINHDSHLVELQSHNFFVKIDSFPYSDDQVDLLNLEMSDFTLNLIGNTVIFTSEKYGFEIVYDKNANFKIKVPSHAKGHLTGLCGLYNNYPNDDKTKSDGEVSKTTVDFGNSWFNPGGKECVETVCPTEKQNAALEICLKLREKPFNLCFEEINLELCIESACDCLTGNKTLDECRCQVFSDFSIKCKSVNLFNWRVEHDCPSSCPPHLVHYDCYPYVCQPTCGNEECIQPATDCYSGCFCPDGLVKKGNQCIKLQQCRDCVCSGLGESTYLTFDGGLNFNGNCTYVATREKNPSNVSSFEVLISNTLCNGSDFMTCTDKIEVRVPGHSIKIIALPESEKMVTILIDGIKENFQKTQKLDKNWSKVAFNTESFSVHVELPREYVDVRYFYKTLAFTISLPSHYYSDKLEGLCGTCSERMTEMDSPENWQTQKDENCLIEPLAPCNPTPQQKSTCLLMNNTTIFGQCSAFVDPGLFIDQCLTLACTNGKICSSLQAYGEACKGAGLCVNWRSDSLCPFTCPPDLKYHSCGCQKTCENYKEITSTCGNPPIEGCFCPDGEVLINGTCKPEKHCELCDEEDHRYEGDLWQVDKCTNCSCKNHVITCVRTDCPEVDIICEEDQVVIKEENAFDCCPKLKCECKHRDECGELEIPNDLLPGMEIIVNETGCCPRVDVSCRPENCPKPEPCKENYIQKMINSTKCCPEYFCEKPTNICIYEFDELSPEGETRLKEGQKTEMMKEVGMQWSDGPCKTCSCVEKDGFAEAVCTISECPNLKDLLDFSDYEFEQVHIPGECCPEIIRKSCKHNGLVYEVGNTWMPDESKPCETMKCNDWGGQVKKEVRLEVCNTNCELGWKYKDLEGTCCGHCIQTGCLVGDKIYKEGEIWFSEDKCSKNTCLMNHSHFIITTETEKCPSIEDCPQEDIYRDECCLKCKIRSEDKKLCSPQILPLESTVKLIRSKRENQGECINEHPIENFTQCTGNCNSFTRFKPETSSHESVCECCKPQEFSLLTVKLKCQDGSHYLKTITVPSKCSCMPCGG